MVYTVALTPPLHHYTSQSSVNVNYVFVAATGQQPMSPPPQKKQHQQPQLHTHPPTNYRIQSQTTHQTQQHHLTRQRQPSRQFDTTSAADLRLESAPTLGDRDDYDDSGEESSASEANAVVESPRRRHHIESDNNAVEPLEYDQIRTEDTSSADAEVTSNAGASHPAMGINNWPAPRRLSVGQQHTNYADPMSWSPAGTTTAAARRRTRDDLAEVGIC